MAYLTIASDMVASTIAKRSAPVLGEDSDLRHRSRKQSDLWLVWRMGGEGSAQLGIERILAQSIVQLRGSACGRMHRAELTKVTLAEKWKGLLVGLASAAAAIGILYVARLWVDG